LARLSRRSTGLIAAAAAAAVVGTVLLTARDAGEPVSPTVTGRAQPPSQPTTLVAIRRLDHRVCRASRLLRPVCPRRVPAAFYPRRGVYLEPRGRARERYDRFDLIGLPRRNLPQHLALFASRYGLDNVFRSEPRRRLGRVVWGGRRGELVLDRSNRAVGDHLVFRWRSPGIEYAFALAAWPPLREAIATLRAIVISGPRRATRV
jgi:hypothetical protein